MIPLVLLTLLIPSLGYNQHSEEQKYEVVFPRKLQAVYKSDIESTYPDIVYYEFKLNGHFTVIQIEKSVGLFADNYTESHYKEDGTLVTSSPRHQDHCHYQGHIKDNANSTVVLSICKGLSGTIQTGKKTFVIEPLRMTDTEEHAVYEAGDILNHTCGVRNVSVSPKPPIFKLMRATDAEKEHLLNAKKHVEWFIVADHSMKEHLLNAKKHVELFIVADHSMYKKYGSSMETLKRRLFDVVNYVNMVYKIIHIFVALIGIEIWDISDQIEVVSNVDKLLQRFVDWKKTSLLPRKHHDNAQFITNVDFDGTTIGYAYMSAMCDALSAAIIQDAFVVAAGVGATIAHEMGHNLGMGHDRPGCTCEANSCMMAPAISNDIPLLFSCCSISDMSRFIYDKYPDCMLDIPVLTEILTPPICGNRFTEIGEECDCGEPEICTDVCCDPYTCKLKPGYECSDGPCCRKCMLKPGGSVCRPAKEECDIADLCDGKSITCANNSFRMNGYPCMDGKGACYKGRCPLMNDQCAAIWGDQATVASDYCFDINTKGNHMGYCRKQGDTYIACENKDKKCGVLYCVGGQNVPRFSGVTITFGTCKTLLYEGGLVNSGTKCNDIEVCSNGKCSNMENTYKTAGCVCPANSICDHELKCQCEAGWAPPKCDVYSAASQFILEVFSLWWWLFVLWMLALDI
ncbi:PREDICTED: zinc metalloproteinase-disintegrin-like batroxstatin-2 [Nanorana parkeri]|uniref:zinc metalloproteinase-disintegrin-like batroxstatin-2 n=1 Tax=Nanorana parkeri TaxID=125878 RepID=UPI0008549C5B|nr:PREDICTED: zinc metalloproteinase-disintegrin-like batroxstatin-2 [Nanorana parkeri]